MCAVALPAMRDDLGVGACGLEWVANAYALTFAGFLQLGGRAADLYGRRRVLAGATLLLPGTQPRAGPGAGAGTRPYRVSEHSGVTA